MHRIEQVNSPLPKLIGTSGAAKLLGRSNKTIHRWIADGKLQPAGRVDNGNVNDAILLYRADVEALAQQNQKTA